MTVSDQRVDAAATVTRLILEDMLDQIRVKDEHISEYSKDDARKRIVNRRRTP